MGLFSEDIQKTSVSLYIERLSNMEEVDWYIFQQLTESMFMQQAGPGEAVETIRKKLKHGGSEQKLRVLEILHLLMQNSNQQFHKTLLANDKLKQRFEIILSSPSESKAVKKELTLLLGAWTIKYKKEHGMETIKSLYEMGKGQRIKPVIKTSNIDRQIRSPESLSPQTPRTPQSQASPVQKKQQPEKRKSLPPPVKPKRPVSGAPVSHTKPRSYSTSSATPPSSSSNTAPRRQRVFNFEKAKPKIIEELALANQFSNNLTNALKLINTREDRWERDLLRDLKLKEYRTKCEESKKKIVRYTRLVEDEEWIGTLLATNEELLKALDMYEMMSVGEIPSVLNSVTIGEERPMITYYESPKSATRPPPPPPNRYSPPLEDSFSGLRINTTAKKETEEPLDPFADPITPIEDDDYYRR
ncbi:hypothetical protein K501DRAFT_262356 [Backusella circina FSU 941]|nr:hypothetical protein K501DRAFT_262356 [Backusella circina FSU 941]